MTNSTRSEQSNVAQVFPPVVMALYKAPRGGPYLVYAPEINFLMIDGAGNPNTSTAYAEAIEALYSVSYTIKFTLKRESGVEYRVMPLEGLWWATDMSAFVSENKDDWFWTMMIAQPEIVTPALLERARRDILAKKKVVPALDAIRLETYHEGRSAQVLYLGPYSAEGPMIARLHEFILEHGYRPSGKHHEIYLGDPRRAAPERLRTIIRQPVSLRE